MNHYMMDNHDSLYYVLHYIDTALADFLVLYQLLLL